MRLAKQFPIKERMNVELIGEAFNLPNHVNYTSVSTVDVHRERKRERRRRGCSPSTTALARITTPTPTSSTTSARFSSARGSTSRVLAPKFAS